MTYPPGATSQSVDVTITDAAGAGVTGLVAGTFPTVHYHIWGANADVSLGALSDLALLTTAWVAKGVKEIGGGVYRLDLPDAVFASAGKVTVRTDDPTKILLLDPIEVGFPAVNVTQVDGAALLSHTAGVLPADVLRWRSSLVAAVNGTMIQTSVNVIQDAAITANSVAAAALNGKGDWLLSSGYTAPPTAAANATAWGDRVIGNGRTADLYLQGATNKVTFAADGLSWTLYDSLDTTPIYSGTSDRLATSVGGLKGIDPT